MIKRKFYFDNEYNTCVCVEPRDYRRVPAEKPFEGHTKIKKKNDENHHVKRIYHRREENFDYQPISCKCKYVPYKPYNETGYKPKLMLSFERFDNPKPISSETTEDQSCGQYPYQQKRTLNGQYPCVYVQPEYFQPCECGCMYKKCEDPKCSYPRRAWNAVKSRTKNIFGSKRKKYNDQKVFNEYFQNYGTPYYYPYPVPYARHVSNKKRHHYTKNHSVGTHKNFNGQSGSISEDVYSTKETCTDDPKICPKRLKESQVVTSPTQEHCKGNECCCVCDVDWCECRCCCTGQCEDNVHRDTQTSIQNIKECFTQTDFPKRCCRCCKCCAKKSKCYPKQSMPANRGPLSGKCVGCDTCMYRNGPCPPTPHYACENNPKNESSPNEKEDQKSIKEYYYLKTQMVKTNSTQCIPIVENKSTSYDDPNISIKMPDLMKNLWEGKYDLNYDEKHKKSMGDVPIYQTNIDWTKNFLQSMSPRKKSKNFVIDDGLFSSPLSGKQYNLSTPEINLSPRLTKKDLPKPLDINDDIFNSSMSKKLYHSYGEHNTLISAICDAILKKHDDEMCIGNSQFICKDDLSSKQDLRDKDSKITQGNQKPKMITKLIPKSILSKTKKPSKPSVFVENSSNTIKTGLIPIRTNKKVVGKKIIKKKIPNENCKNCDSCNEKKALKKVSNRERFDYDSSKSRDFYQNLVNKHFSGQRSQKENKDFENQRSSSPIDYDKIKDLDFSSIQFKKPHFDMNASEYFHQKYSDQKNFILNNLPSYSSSISNEYQIKSLLSEEKIPTSSELLEKTSSPILQQTPPVSTTVLHPKINLKINVKNDDKLIKMEQRPRNIDDILFEFEEEGQGRKYKDFNFFGKRN